MNDFERKMANGQSPYISDFRKHGWNYFLALAILLFFFSLTFRSSSTDAVKVARKFGERIEIRLRILEHYADQAMAAEEGSWMEFSHFPEDMVIYRYVYDTLQSWCNQFPVSNDNINARMVVKRLDNLRAGISSPLSEVTAGTHYMTLGSKCYIMRTRADHLGSRIVYGLEIQNTLMADRQNSEYGVNPRLRLPKSYTVTALSHTGGEPVTVEGKPLLKIISETTREIPVPTNDILRWLALLCLIISILLWLRLHPSLKSFPAVILIFTVIGIVAYRWGLQLRNVSALFSPGIYADGQIFSSLGALIISGCLVFCYLSSVYLCRVAFIHKAFRSGKLFPRIVYATGIVLTIAGALVYIHVTLVSLVLNSSITLELYQWFSLSWYTLIVYVLYLSNMFCVILLIQMLRPVVYDFTGWKYSIFSKRWLMGFSVLSAVYLTIMSGALGFKKEQDRLIIATNRLAMDRNLSLEIQLRSVEDAIASDPMVAALSQLDRSDMIILNRLNENYLYRISQDYGVTATLCRDNAQRYTGSGEDTPCLNHFGRKYLSGKQIAPNSRFRFISDNLGNSNYIGSFVYYSPDSGVVHMFLEIEAKAHPGEHGYINIVGRRSRPDHVNISPAYSYSKFISGKLVRYRGNYPYPSMLNQAVTEDIQNDVKYFRERGYVHFINRISSEEVIITSRPTRGWLVYLINFSYLVIFTYGALYIYSRLRQEKKTQMVRNYYRSRINTVFSLSLFLTLVTMTVATVAFVSRRNSNNLYNLMSDKINTIQSLLEAKIQHIQDWRELNSPEIMRAMEDIGLTTKSDITLYTTSGKVFTSTAPEVFEKMILGARMNQEAYHSIKFRNQRFCICRENIGDFSYYALYAPLYNDSGDMLAIVNAPYTEQNYVLRYDTFFYSAIIINVFIVLLIVTILFSTTLVNAIFKPITEMGQKMSSTDIHSLEHIQYDRDDEISTLVQAYNRMVTDLSESTVKLAQAERDKAWSEMARQVAHEIKNPLTPIRMQIQNLIRLKQNNNPKWIERFDRVSAVVIEQIDILAETANDFSTFAKLYTEEPVLMDLDAALRDQLLIFDNKDNINFSYLGMPDAWVYAPKPQLIRVFVNLLTNAVQAIDIMQQSQSEAGGEVKTGEILVCLRNSTEDGYFDIVFEDNGPGVREENQNKLFTPNFTTKSAGTGLGLAISRNIVEKCGGQILYRKSYSLYGACFTVRLPKPKPMA